MRGHKKAIVTHGLVKSYQIIDDMSICFRRILFRDFFMLMLSFTKNLLKGIEFTLFYFF